MDQKTICLIAGQRTGTNAFRAALASAGPFTDFGEIFETDARSRPQQFFNWSRERGILLADLNSGQAVDKVCTDYLMFLRAEAGEQHVLMDIKFSLWGVLRQPWSFVHQEPYLLRFLKHHRTIFFLIWREDIAAQVLSERVAFKIGKWSNLKATDTPEPFVVDIGSITERTRLQCLSEEFFLEELRGYPKHQVLRYEDMFDAGNGIAPDVARQVERATGQKCNFQPKGIFHKNRVELRDCFVNYDEAVAAIERTAGRYRTKFLADVVLR